jgi:hypothetical protein
MGCGKSTPVVPEQVLRQYSSIAVQTSFNSIIVSRNSPSNNQSSSKITLPKDTSDELLQMYNSCDKDQTLNFRNLDAQNPENGMSITTLRKRLPSSGKTKIFLSKIENEEKSDGSDYSCEHNQHYSFMRIVSQERFNTEPNLCDIDGLDSCRSCWVSKMKRKSYSVTN